MTRHFTGKVTTIWALGAGDEAASGGGQALVTIPLSDSEKSRIGGAVGVAQGWLEPQPRT